MAELKKIETHLQQFSQKNKPPLLIDQTPPEFQQLFSPYLLIKKK